MSMYHNTNESGDSHAHSAFLNDLLDSFYCAVRTDCLVPTSRLGELVVMARAPQADPQAAGGPDAEVELELLKIAVTNPDLYNQLRVVFTEHQSPQYLSAVGGQIRRVFLNQKEI